jgi:hypothetical protein
MSITTGLKILESEARIQELNIKIDKMIREKQKIKRAISRGNAEVSKLDQSIGAGKEARRRLKSYIHYTKNNAKR